MADSLIVQELRQRIEARDKRLTFLASRFEKDIRKLVQNVLIILQSGKKVRISETLTKI